jgi:hypothetical protein
MNTTKAGKIISEGTQLFSVPNTEEGRNWYRLAKKYRNRGNLYARGRGTRKNHGNGQHIAVEHSEWFAVYLKELQDFGWTLRMKDYYKNENDTLRKDKQKLINSNDDLHNVINNLSTKIDKLQKELEDERSNKLQMEAQFGILIQGLNEEVEYLKSEDKTNPEKPKTIHLTINL